MKTGLAETRNKLEDTNLKTTENEETHIEKDDKAQINSCGQLRQPMR